MRVIVWALLGMLALIVLPICVLLFAGMMRRFQIARTQRELARMGFVGSVPYDHESRPLWQLVGAGLVGVVALFIATSVLPGPPAGRIVASTDGSSLGDGPSLAPVVASPSTNPGSDHTSSPSGQPATSHGSGSHPVNSSPASVSPAAQGGSHAGPANVTAVPASATTIKLQWEPVTGAASYDVERSTQTVPWDTVATTRGNQNRYTDVALSSGTTYYYRVAAHVEGEDIARSDVVSVTTTVDTPAAPELVSATGAAASVDLAWDDVDGESGYRVERSSDGTSGWAAIAWTGQDVNTYTDAGLDPATTFYYRVVALTSDAGSTSAPSNVQSATTDPDASSSGPSTSEANAPTSDAPIGP